ncbi:MFS transporter [Pedobacter sp. MC2016-15]|uniref:MFS transporter n=1 Tax=Pedobacter sp. MC2016-15 TaxID=2994473 RepID=UPI00224760C0|nr:MFS transporter [Pedobacter sp. MC2016-15]MCX2480977.1 MFS transporter [Pedobacter sp. MC2016-15]
MSSSDLTQSHFSGYQKFVITILALTQFTVILDFMVMAPLGDLLMKSLKMTPGEFAFSVSAYAFSAGLSGLLTAGFADRFDRKKLLLFFYLGFIIGTFFCALANSYATLIAARIFTGLFGGVIASISMAIVTDIFGLGKRGRVMGFVQMGLGGSQVLGVPVSIYIASKWGWEAPFWLVVGLGVLTFTAIFLKLQPITAHLKVKQHTSPLTHLWHTLTFRNYRICYVATALIAVSSFMMSPFSTSFTLNNLGMSYDQLTLLMMIAGISSLFIMPFIGRLSDKIEKINIFSVAIIITIVVVIIYTHMGQSSFTMVLIINILLSGGMISRMIPATALTTGVPQHTDRGAFMSVNSSIQQIAGGIGAAIAGQVVTQHGQGMPLGNYGILGFTVASFSMLAWFFIYRVDKLVKFLDHPNGTGKMAGVTQSTT